MISIKDIVLETLIAIVLLLVYFFFDYVCIVKRCIEDLGGNMNSFKKKYFKYVDYQMKARYSGSRSYIEVDEFLKANKSNIDSARSMVIIRAICLFVYAVIVAIIMVNFVLYFCLDYSVFAAVAFVICFVIFSVIVEQKNVWLKQNLGLEQIVRFYNSLLLEFSRLLNMRK